VPAGVPATGQVRFVEYIDGQAVRNMSLSRSKCDFRGFVVGAASLKDPTSVNYPMDWSNDINPIILFGKTNQPQLQAGQTYYFNLRNIDWTTGIGSCLTGTCNGRIQISTP
jgi:hypothetical protein